MANETLRFAGAEVQGRKDPGMGFKVLGAQIRFAQALSKRTGESLAEILFKYSPMYRSLANRPFSPEDKNDPDDPLWREFTAGLDAGKPPLEWSQQLYLRERAKHPPAEKEKFGCFSFDYEEGGVIRIHFGNRDDAEPGALSKERIEARRAELARMFRHIKKIHPDARVVRGDSWLYNLEAYRRLFPENYGAAAKLKPFDPKRRALWGQFLDSHGQIKEDLIQRLEDNVSDPDKKEEEWFPHNILKTEASIADFYRFYGIE